VTLSQSQLGQKVLASIKSLQSNIVL